MKCIIGHQVVLRRIPEGPIAGHLASFAQALSSQGYRASSIHEQVLLASCFSRWLARRGVGLRSITADHSRRYLRYRRRHVRRRSQDAAALGHLVAFLRSQGLVPAEKASIPRPNPVEQWVQAYEQYLREARALARGTIINYASFTRSFLKDRFGDGHVTLSRLEADDIVRFVQRQAPRLHPKRAKLMTGALRSFLQYARYRGEVRRDLAAAVPVVANWSMSSIPRAIAPEQVRKLLASIDRRSPVGRRDYAILLLLARLGLRRGEVACLELDDIDWNTARLSVRGKAGRRTGLPLLAEVGQAIAAYLHDGRGRSTSRRVFLRAKAPLGEFRTSCAVGSLVRHALDRAGIEAPTRGAHQFRHGLATELLRQGASLGEIGELLGHRHPDSTRIYTKVDLKALRTLALPWPGGAR